MNTQRIRNKAVAFGALVLALAFVHTSAGLRWSEFFHPDELPIANWMQQAHRNGYVTERAYPGGWFVLSCAWTHAEAGLWRLRERWRAHRRQVGRVKAIDADTFDFAPERETFRAGEIQRGRDINAVLVAFAALFLYLAALEAGARPPAAALGALLLAAQPFLLEHAHYCETDAAVPFSLSLAGWLSMRAIRLRSWRWHLGAMAAAGFAIACKYTLAPLALWPATVAVPIALSLAALGIRIIAPIPGKGTIGIEVPNAKPQIVSMESILNSKKFQETTMELPMALGKTITNEVFIADLVKMPHLLVAGATGQGKSVGLNAIITSLLYKKHPAELKFVMVDPKKVEFPIYSPIVNHFLAQIEDDEEDEPIITDVQKVVNTLKSLCVEMDTRYDLLKKARARNIKEYNEKFKNRQLNPQNGHKFMPYIVVIIDEFGDLIMTAGKEIELPIARIAQLARAVGIHMIIATQRPTTNIITGTIKANFPARMAFKVSAMVDSRTILDRPGANQLVGKGDMLFLAGSEPVRLQCAFVDTPEVEAIANYIACQQSYTGPFALPRPPMEDTGGGVNDADLQHLDPMFAEAAQLIVSSQQGSTSMIQRKFAIGYNRAGRLMDQLEKAGVVGPAQGAKPRDVLIQDAAALEMLLNNLG